MDSGLLDRIEYFVLFDSVADMAGSHEVGAGVVCVVGEWYEMVPVNLEPDPLSLSPYKRAETLVAIEALVLLDG